MHYGNIKKFSIENGPGVRVSLFVSGCRNHCENCFSPQTWSFTYGTPFTGETKREILEALSPSHIAGLTVLGGEPFEPENQRELLPFLVQVREALPEKTIWIYTGFLLDQELLGESRGHCGETEEILKLTDVLVDGRFEEDKKNLRIRFRGSENQRIIDIPKTLAGGKIVLMEEYMKERE